MIKEIRAQKHSSTAFSVVCTMSWSEWQAGRGFNITTGGYFILPKINDKWSDSGCFPDSMIMGDWRCAGINARTINGGVEAEYVYTTQKPKPEPEVRSWEFDTSGPCPPNIHKHMPGLGWGNEFCSTPACPFAMSLEKAEKIIISEKEDRGHVRVVFHNGEGMDFDVSHELQGSIALNLVKKADKPEGVSK